MGTGVEVREEDGVRVLHFFFFFDSLIILKLRLLLILIGTTLSKLLLASGLLHSHRARTARIINSDPFILLTMSLADGWAAKLLRI